MRGFFVGMTVQETLLHTGRTTESSIGKGAKNRVKSVLNQSRFTIIDGPNQSGSITASRFRSLDDISYHPSSDPLERARVNAALPLVADSLVGRGNRYIKGIGTDGLDTIPQIAINIAGEGADKTGTVFRMVYGATSEMPARALSYPLPVLEMMSAMHDCQKDMDPPQLQIIFANNTSAQRNGISPTDAHDQAMLFSETARNYIAGFYPEVADRVVFLEDTPETAEHPEIMLLAERLRGNSAITEGLQRRGRVDDIQTSLEYGGAHLLFHDLAVPDMFTPIFANQGTMVEPQTIINVGGHQEIFFYGVRQELRAALVDSYDFVPTAQFITRHHVPPYTLSQGERLTLDGFLRADSVDIDSLPQAAGYDMRYLRDITSEKLREGGMQV